MHLSRVSPFRALALTACAAALSPLAAQDGALATVPQGSLRGVEAAGLGARLASIAEANTMDLATLREELANDESVWVTPDDRILHVDPPAPAASSYADFVSLLELGPIPLEDAFVLHSNPGAPRTIFLDFDGHHSVGNSWGHNIVFPAFDTNGDSSSFSDDELSDIISQWRLVTEDFAIFDDVDVTTEDPGVAALSKSGGGDQTWGIRCLMTQSTSGFGDGIGGVAYLWSFNDSIDNPCFSFNKGTNNSAMTASHEVGHALGLSHDGLGGSTYHPGTGSGSAGWGPIMGAPFGTSLVQWSEGNYPSATNTQDDIQTITASTNGLSIRADDHSSNIFSATPLPLEVGCPDPVAALAVGIIERDNDVDAFSFQTVGGFVTVETLPMNNGNLDARMQLFTNGGSLLADVNPDNNSAASITIELAPGTYRLTVDGVGNSNNNNEDYGSLGNYRVRVATQDQIVTTNLGGKVAGLLGVFPKLTITGGGCEGDPIELTLTKAVPNKPAYLVVSTGFLGAPFKGGLLIPDLGVPNLIIPVTTNAIGNYVLSTEFPESFPSGGMIYAQYWIEDTAGIAGFSATVGHEIVAP